MHSTGGHVVHGIFHISNFVSFIYINKQNIIPAGQMYAAVHSDSTSVMLSGKVTSIYIIYIYIYTN